jgi:hypothetical protein
MKAQGWCRGCKRWLCVCTGRQSESPATGTLGTPAPHVAHSRPMAQMTEPHARERIARHRREGYASGYCDLGRDDAEDLLAAGEALLAALDASRAETAQATRRADDERDLRRDAEHLLESAKGRLAAAWPSAERLGRVIHAAHIEGAELKAQVFDGVYVPPPWDDLLESERACYVRQGMAALAALGEAVGS